MSEDLDPGEGFDEADLYAMQWAPGSDGGKRIKLSVTPELAADYAAWQAGACRHPQDAFVFIRARNGAEMHRRQCVTCGFPTSQWVARANVPDVDKAYEVPAEMFGDYQKARAAEWERVQAHHVARQTESGDLEYARYLASAEWQRKRAKVFERAGGLCEGCRSRKATQVHHLTYKHVGAEFLWELVAICDRCHARIHDEEEA